MQVRIRKLSTRLLVAIVTFTIGVAVTMMWVVPRFSTEETPTIPVVLLPPNKHDTLLRKGWKKLDFYGKVELMVPPDMKEAEVYGDPIRDARALENGKIHISMVGDVWDTTIQDKVRKEKFYLCNGPEILTKHPTYSESLIQIDGRQARLGIARLNKSGSISANVCFPVPDDPVHEFLVGASCKDDQALATAMEIFNSITFRN